MRPGEVQTACPAEVLDVVGSPPSARACHTMTCVEQTLRLRFL